MGIIAGSTAPSGAAGGSLAGTYPNPELAVGAVSTGILAAGAVTSPKTATIALLAPTSKNANLENASAAFNELQFCSNLWNNMCFCRGAAKVKAASAVKTTEAFCTLTAEQRPTRTRYIKGTIAGGAGATVTFEVLENGEVKPMTELTAAQEVSLDGTSFIR